MNQLLSFAASIRWQDVVDITLNSYILFRLYVLFRGTNAFKVLVGMALLWLFQRMAVSVGLIITNWALQGVIAAAAIIVIVVFRNEIHSVLQAKKLKAVLWSFPHKTHPTPVEIIAESVFELSRKRAGALIVLPGKEDLKEIVQSGITWRGLVSKEMVLSIFWQGNPVHDGAAVIQGNKVIEVGVILPLSRRQDLPSRYGTRHRAALGLAEATDAMVIVVSEENGNVLVAKGSHTHPVDRIDELEQILRQHVGVPVELPSYRSREGIRLGAAAVASVLFVTSIWFSFSRGLESLTTVEIPVQYMNRDPAMEILDTSQHGVRLHLSGSGPLIGSIGPEQVTVRLDLNNATAGDNMFTITPENITLPPGVFLKKIEQPSVEVTLDFPTEKALPIQVDWTGKLPEHLILSEARVYPEKVHVVGGSRILKDITTVYTEEIPLETIQESGSITVDLALKPASLQTAPGSRDSVTVEYKVRRLN